MREDAPMINFCMRKATSAIFARAKGGVEADGM